MFFVYLFIIIIIAIIVLKLLNDANLG